MNKKILVVDDDTELREALTLTLNRDGYQVLSAKDGAEGFTIALSEKPDLILLDIWMPKVNGLQMLGELRKDAWGKKAKVLLLTNADDPMNVAHGVELKSNDYIIKSHTSLETILKTVKQHIVGYYD